jgi:hypothetical protein
VQVPHSLRRDPATRITPSAGLNCTSTQFKRREFSPPLELRLNKWSAA